MSWSIASPPALDSKALEDFRLQVREASTAFDDELTRNLNAAVSVLQKELNRQFLNATAVYTRERFPPGKDHLFLPPSPLVSVTSLTYTDGDGNSQTWSNTLYDVIINQEPGWVEPVQDESYPQGTRDVIVTYVSGYGATWGTVDDSIRQVVLMLAETFFRGTDWGDLMDHMRANAKVGDEFYAYP